MPVNLPPQPGGHILRPIQPADPPSFQDVHRARVYSDDIKLNSVITVQQPHGPTSDDATRAELYKTTVMVAHADQDAFGPGLANAAAQALAQALPNALALALPNALASALAPLQQSLLRLERSVAQSKNWQLGDGMAHPYDILPFENGMPPAALPALRTVADIRTLTFAQVNAYLAGYGLPQVGTAVARKQRLADFIGCRVVL